MWSKVAEFGLSIICSHRHAIKCTYSFFFTMSSETTSTPTYPITPQVFTSLKIAKIFRDNQKTITSLCFDDLGEVCITSAEDESLHVYDCKAGKLKATLFSKKYGVHLARFTHRQNNVIYASTKEDDTLRYLSLHDNKYIRYFKGHKKKVVALEMSPLDDQFLSASFDDTVRLWDLRSSTCQGLVNTPGRPVIAFDQSGLVFAIGLNASTIRMYDLKNFDKGPFDMWTVIDPLSPTRLPEFTSLKFSNDGKNILITTAGEAHYMIDSYTGALKQRFMGHMPLELGGSANATTETAAESTVKEVAGGGEAGFTPDGRFVISGSQDGSISIWDTQSPQSGDRPIVTLEGHTSPTSVVGFNPKHMMMVSGCTELAFWEPDLRSKPNAS